MVTRAFVVPLTVVRSEIDELGHASNIAYLHWVQDVAKAHSESVGWDHAAYVKLGGVFVVTKHEIEYLAPAMNGDELQLITWIESWTAVTSERRTRIERGRQGARTVHDHLGLRVAGGKAPAHPGRGAGRVRRLTAAQLGTGSRVRILLGPRSCPVASCSLESLALSSSAARSHLRRRLTTQGVPRTSLPIRSAWARQPSAAATTATAAATTVSVRPGPRSACQGRGPARRA
ncbi:MAG: acyl-CoA thioesterase [Myxococcales bacterium]|nr:acyl-CoA thioesterase [Myxococcales bacterium]